MTTRRTATKINCAALALAGGVFTHVLPATVRAQDAKLADAELPPVVVEGATLEAAPATTPKPKAKPKPQVVKSTDGPPAEPAKKAANAPGDDTAPPADDVGEVAGDIPDAAFNGSDQTTANGDVSGIPASKLGTAVSVVTRAELKDRQVRTAADALRSLPGVSVSQQSGRQNLTVVRIRGAESNQTLVLIDGVEVNAGSDGFFDFSNLMVDDIAQIEVLRGPQSGLYSSGAIGGVINIITRGGKGPLTVRARVEGGSFNTRDAMVGISGGTDRAHGSLTLSGLRTNGFDISDAGTEKDGGEFRTLSFAGGLLVLPNLKIDATVRTSHRDGDRDGSNDIRDGLFVSSEERSTFASDLWLGRLDATLDTFDHAWTHKLYVNGAQTENSDLDLGIYSPPAGLLSRNISTTTKYGYLSTFRLGEGGPVQHAITGMLEHTREAFEQPLIASDAFERDRNSVAGEIRGEYFDTLSLTANIRHDNNEGFEDATTWRVTGSLQIATPFRLHSSVGTGIKYPSFSEQFGVFYGFVANPDLKPETSLGWDVGLETTFLAGKGIVDVTYFNANLEDEIDFDFVPPASACGSTPFCFIPFNRTGQSTREGVEVSAKFLVMDGLTLGAAYTYLNAKESDGQEEVRRPPHSGRAELNYVFDAGKGNFNLAAIYNGQMQDLGFSAITFSSQRVALDSYWLVSAAASYQIAPNMELFGRIENLLNQNYEEVYGFNTAGLAAYAGMRIKFEDPSTLEWAQYK